MELVIGLIIVVCIFNGTRIIYPKEGTRFHYSQEMADRKNWIAKRTAYACSFIQVIALVYFYAWGTATFGLHALWFTLWVFAAVLTGMVLFLTIIAHIRSKKSVVVSTSKIAKFLRENL